MMFGIILDNAVAIPSWLNVTVCALTLLSLLLRRVRTKIVRWLVPLSTACLGSVLHDGFMRRLPDDAIARYVSIEPVLVHITGTVDTAPSPSNPRAGFFDRWAYQPETTRFRLSATSLDGAQGPVFVRGAVDVRANGRLAGIEAGDRVSILGMLYRPGPPSNPGQFDYSLWLRRHGVHASLRCSGSNSIQKIQDGRRSGSAILHRLRSFARSALMDSDVDRDAETGGLIETMVLGRRQTIDRRVEDMFRRTGTSHFLAVSGLHVGVVAWFVWAAGRLVGMPRRRVALLVMIAVTLYAGLVDPRPPVFRATIIGVVACVGMLIGRAAVSLNSLSLAAIILLCIRPTALFEPGFQMSFAGVLGILLLTHPIARNLRWPNPNRDFLKIPVVKRRSTTHPLLRLTFRAGHALRLAAAVGIGASLATAPFIVYHFDYLAPLAPINSLILSPFFALTLFLGVLNICAQALAPVLAAFISQLVTFSADLLLIVSSTLDGFNPPLHGLAASFVRIAYFILAGIAILMTFINTSSTARLAAQRTRAWIKDRTSSRPAGTALAVAALAVAALAGLFAAAHFFLARPRPESLTICQLSVGRGSATVIEFPDGTTWIFDCGNGHPGDVGANVVVPYCRHRGIRRIDQLLISHPDREHFSGLFSIMDVLDVGSVSINRHFEFYSAPDGPARYMSIEMANRRRELALVDDHLNRQSEFGGAHVEYLWPPQAIPDEWAADDTSTVLRISYLGSSVLLCGDLSSNAQSWLLEDDVQADVLVLPGGGLDADAAAFINAVNPAICIRSSHQSLRTMSTKQREFLGDREVFNTADDGAISLRVDAARIQINTHRSRRTWNREITAMQKNVATGR